MIKPFDFDKEVAIEVILYLANHLSDPTLHKISKLIYFADKFHLEKYGRFICGDSYVAMKHGPVPSGIYDILKAARDQRFHFVSEQINEVIRVENNTVIPFREADLDYFSDSDIACLDEAIATYGQMSFGQLTKLSHDGAWHTTGENDLIELEQIACTLKGAEALLEYLKDPYPG